MHIIVPLPKGRLLQKIFLGFGWGGGGGGAGGRDGKYMCIILQLLADIHTHHDSIPAISTPV